MVVQSAISVTLWQLSHAGGNLILFGLLGNIHADGVVVLGDIVESVKALNDQLDTLVMLKLVERVEDGGTRRRMNGPLEDFLHVGFILIHDLEEDGGEVSQLVHIHRGLGIKYFFLGCGNPAGSDFLLKFVQVALNRQQVIEIFSVRIDVLAAWHDQAADTSREQVAELVDEVPQPCVALTDEVLLNSSFGRLLFRRPWVIGWSLTVLGGLHWHRGRHVLAYYSSYNPRLHHADQRRLTKRRSLRRLLSDIGRDGLN